MKGICRGLTFLLTGAWVEILLRNPRNWGWDLILVGVPLYFCAVYGWKKD